MKNLLFYILSIGLFSINSWGQEKSHSVDLNQNTERDSTPRLSRFLQNIDIAQDHSFTFNRDFLKPKEVSLKKMLQTRYYNSINYLKEASLNETLYPNLNYPSGILIENTTQFLIRPFPQVNTKL
ncbi:hypothetical protein LX95_01627 [Mesonia algae]|uniref:Uncharacterized protein n=1 Tax=Mesonia algae TaxID=213248 RepID=A0A2W7IPJ1_9FLAO|nr:hypothetical protein [Mesonia algae]PZW40563.1 hypothetical protein LX95_01627 [Mesonia algae]